MIADSPRIRRKRQIEPRDRRRGGVERERDVARRPVAERIFGDQVQGVRAVAQRPAVELVQASNVQCKAAVRLSIRKNVGEVGGGRGIEAGFEDSDRARVRQRPLNRRVRGDAVGIAASGVVHQTGRQNGRVGFGGHGSAVVEPRGVEGGGFVDFGGIEEAIQA